MKPLRLILPITLFILSGVLAYYLGEPFDKLIQSGTNPFLVMFITISIMIYFGTVIALFIWALGGFDD